MQKRLSLIGRYTMLGVGLLIHIAFFISACKTKWFNYFFSDIALHLCCRGLDFYTVPNGAYSYWHGGPLGYTPGSTSYLYGVGFPNSNSTVYHPLFVLILGTFLTLLSPASSFYVWMFIKLFVNLGMLTYFYLNFRESKYIHLALFLSLINSTQYLEIEISQFQFVLNMFLFVMLIILAKNEKSEAGGPLYFLTLVAKPIGLLWIPLFAFKRQWKLLLIGLSWFLIATVMFLFNHLGDYYINRLVATIFPPYTDGPIQIITLGALLRYSTHLPYNALVAIRYGCLAIVIILSSFKRISIQTGIFLAIAYYLLFYDLTYEYQYTTLIPILAVCLVTRPEFQRLSSRICIILISSPNIIFLLRLLSSWHFKLGSFDASQTLVADAYFGTNPTLLGWQLCVLSRIIPVIALAICAVQPFVVPIAKDTLVFVRAVRKINQQLELFG